MPSIIENLNSVINTKNELGYILRENGVNPGEVFSDYPTYFRDVISSGGGGSDKVTYSYLEERLSDYVSYSYLNDNLSDYPTYSYSNNNYVSYAYLNEQEYATESYVAEYVAEHGGGEVTYAYLNDNYFKLTGGLFNGNIIPKYQNTYSLGTIHLNFGSVWTRRLISDNRLNLTSNYGDGYHGLKLENNLFGPFNQDNLYNLGNSTYQWASVYSKNYLLNGTDIKEIFPSYSYVNKYVTKTELSAQSYITSADLPDLSTYVTKDELSACGYITSSDLPDLSTYVTKDELSACGYLTSVPNTYPTYAAIESMGYITSADLPDLSAYVTKTELSAQSYLTAVPNTYPTYAAIESMGYITSADLPDLSTYVTKTELSACGYLTSVPSEYITQDELSANSYLTEHQSLAGYATESYVADYVATYAPTPELSTYVTKTELSAQSYLTAVPNTYPTYAAIESMGYITSADLPVIDENIIPKKNTTYNLGSSTYKYKQVWANNLYGSLSGDIYNASNLVINLNNAPKYRISSDSIRPDSDNTSATLGTSNYKFGATYTSNLYLGSYNIKDLINGMFSYDSTTGTLTITTLS